MSISGGVSLIDSSGAIDEILCTDARWDDLEG